MGIVIFPTLAALSELNDAQGKRDAMSGNGIDLLIITKDGAKEKSIEITELGE